MPDLIPSYGKRPKGIVEGGALRVFLHDGATEMMTFVRCHGALSPRMISYHCGALLNGRMLQTALPRALLAEVTNASEIHVGEIPTQPIVKMMKSVHADWLVNEGKIRLGSVEYYRQHENPEVRDPQEGICILTAYDGNETHIYHVRGGLNDRLLCCYVGDPDPDVINRFGYDAAVEITDVAGFLDAISRSLGSTESSFARCLYVRDRVIYGSVNTPLSVQGAIDGDAAEILGLARAFLKHESYKHQSEFRFLWRGQGHLTDYLDIICPELTRFCRRVSF